jgi:excisionase family DNA binding protein
MQEVTIAEAAKCLGISTDTIRRRINKGELQARKVPSSHGDQYMVEIPDDISVAAQRNNENSAEIDILRKTISILETELEARRREIQELHVLLQQAQSALPSRKEQPVKLSWWQKLLPGFKKRDYKA